MLPRNLFVIASAVALSACVYPTPNRWTPYPVGYYQYPQTYPRPYAPAYPELVVTTAAHNAIHVASGRVRPAARRG
jgi:hypothetical protein